MTGDQKRRADKIMKLLLRDGPVQDSLVLTNVIAAFMMRCHAPDKPVDVLCEGVDALAGDVKTGLRLLFAQPYGRPQ